MTTLYDWITVSTFAGLVALFLHRSDQLSPHRDSLWQYLVAAAGCAAVNWLGNDGRHYVAIVALSCLAAFIVLVLKPFSSSG